MATAIKICKYCGNEYEYCHTLRKKDAFRYQDVACCPEHASEYFKLVIEARSKANEPLEHTSDVAPIKEDVVSTKEDFVTVEEVVNIPEEDDIFLFDDEDAEEDDEIFDDLDEEEGDEF